MTKTIRRWLREPLLQFLVAGLLLFAGYHWMNGKSGRPDPSGRIEITADDLRQIRYAWAAQGRETLTAEQLRRLVDDKVREEILYREALALGLDQDDTIVRRRLAQKMDFLFEDVAALRNPTAGELRAWFAKNSRRFELPARVTFRHLYFTPDRRGTRAREDAAGALGKLSGKPEDAPGASALGDPFMFKDYYADRSFDEVARDFGPGFARAVFDLAPGAWRGPIESGYGWHLVWVDSITRARVPAFEDVEADVRRDWTEDQRGEIRERAYRAMRARYQVILPKDRDAANLGNVRATKVDRSGEPQ